MYDDLRRFSMILEFSHSWEQYKKRHVFKKGFCWFLIEKRDFLKIYSYNTERQGKY